MRNRDEIPRQLISWDSCIILRMAAWYEYQKWLGFLLVVAPW